MELLATLAVVSTDRPRRGLLRRIERMLRGTAVVVAAPVVVVMMVRGALDVLARGTASGISGTEPGRGEAVVRDAAVVVAGV